MLVPDAVKKAAPVDRPRSWISKKYTSFDGLRGFAVLLVFVNHYGQLSMPQGAAMTLWWGVDLFFVLSGFLITGILYESKGEPGYFQRFYIRRTLRIFPLYYGVLFLLIALVPILHMTSSGLFWTNFFYLSNLARLHPQIANPTYLDFIRHPHLGLHFGHFWSLCVEEQFYFVWPVILWLLPSRKAMMWVAGAAAGASLTLRVGLFLHNPTQVAHTHYLYFFTPTRCDGLFIGAWMALWLRGRKLRRRELQTAAYGLLGPALLILLVGGLTVGRRWAFDEVNPLLCTYGYTLIDLACAGLLLLAVDEQSWLSRVFRFRGLRELGIISYGFYLLHGIPLAFFALFRDTHPNLPHAGSIAIVLGFTCCFSAAWLSYRYFETPFLRLKDRFAPPSGHASVPSGNKKATRALRMSSLS